MEMYGRKNRKSCRRFRWSAPIGGKGGPPFCCASFGARFQGGATRRLHLSYSALCLAAMRGSERAAFRLVIRTLCFICNATLRERIWLLPHLPPHAVLDEVVGCARKGYGRLSGPRTLKLVDWDLYRAGSLELQGTEISDTLSQCRLVGTKGFR